MSVRFTDGARCVVAVATRERQLLGHHVLGTGHLLLGLLVADDDGLAANLLWGCDLTVDLVRAKVAELSSQPPATADAPRVFSDRAKRALEDALLAASVEGPTVGPDELLLSVIGLRTSVAVRILTAFGLDLTHLEAAIASARGMAPPPRPPPLGSEGDEEARLIAVVRAGAVARREMEGPALSLPLRAERRQVVAAGDQAWQELLARWMPPADDLA
jgi:ATP-dependent Clp protease ATP-binding subunit ClpA